nr:hypothetical protein [bacterium]
MINLDEELKKLSDISTLDELENWYQALLGKKGSITEALKNLGNLSPEEKKVQ